MCSSGIMDQSSKKHIPSIQIIFNPFKLGIKVPVQIKRLIRAVSSFVIKLCLNDQTTESP